MVAERLKAAWVSDQTSEQRETLERQVVRQEREVDNLVGAIATAGQIEALAERLRETQESLNEARYQLERLRIRRRAAPTIPTHAELKKLLGEAMSRVIEGDDEACRLMSRVLPDIVLRPARSLDNENVALQAVFDLDVGAAVAALTEQDHPGVIEREQLVVNLFDLPMHVLYAERLGTVEQRGERVLKTADELGISYGTAAMARRLWWILEDLGIREAYEPVTAPPEHGWKCRRHLPSGITSSRCPTPTATPGVRSSPTVLIWPACLMCAPRVPRRVFSARSIDAFGRGRHGDRSLRRRTRGIDNCRKRFDRSTP